MASSNLLPHCSVCKRTLRYGGFDPYLLPCLHTVCSDCMNHKGTTLACCHCDETFSKQDYIFLKDVITNAEIVSSTARNNPLEIKCTNKTHNFSAEIWCRDCQVFFCKKCQIAHSQVKTAHSHDMIQVKSLGSGEPLTLKSLCPEHKSYPLDLYDVTCEILICSRCSRTEHKQCSVEEIEGTSMSEKREAIKENRQKIDEHLQKVVKTLESVEEKKTENEARKIKMEKWLTHQFDSLRKLVQRREEELSHALASMYKFNADEFRKVSKSLDRTAEKLQAVSEYGKKLCNHGDKTDFLMLNPRAQSRVEACLKEEIPKLDIPEVIVAFKKGSLEKLSASLSNFGSIDVAEEGADEEKRQSYENVEIELPPESEESSLYVNAVTETENKPMRRKPSYLPMQSVPGSSEDDKEGQDEDGTHDKDIETSKPDILEEPLYNDCSNVEEPSCPKLQLDNERINTNKVHISKDGCLTNTKLHGDRVFTQYVGTIATTPLPGNILNYWEVDTDIKIDQQMQKHGILMEIGVVDGDNIDQQYCASGQENARCLTISYCASHSSICAKAWNRRTKLSCNVGIAANKPGETLSVKYGILHDKTNKTVSFFDIDEMEIVDIMADDPSAKEIWPIFGVYNPSLASVKMKLVSGNEIDLSEKKLTLLEERLTCGISC